MSNPSETSPEESRPPGIDPQEFLVFRKDLAQASYFFAELKGQDEIIEKKIMASRASGDERTPYQKDADKVGASLFLLRLQNISQVDHPTAYKELGKDDHNAWGKQYYNSRLTHTFQVARLARQIAHRYANLPEDHPDRAIVDSYGGIYPYVAEAAALAHDIGHPPYGHVCETFLAKQMQEYGGFEGNAQTLRILTSLNPNSNRNGINLTRRAFAACLKYPWTYEETQVAARKSGGKPMSKYSLYDAQPDQPGDKPPLVGARLLSWVYQKDGPITADLPQVRIKTPEAEIMDYADDVAYATSDFFEAFPGNQELRALLTWEDFAAFVKTSKRVRKAFEKAGLELEIDGVEFNPNAPKLDLGAVGLGRINWAMLYLVHRLVLAKVSIREKQTDFVLAMAVENALKGILMNPQLRIPKGPFEMPSTAEKLVEELQGLADDSCWMDDTFRIVPPYRVNVSVGDDVAFYRTAEVGIIARVLLCVLKEAVVKFVHKQGDQRARHLVRGLRCAILLKAFVVRWVDEYAKMTRLAKAIFRDSSVDAMTSLISNKDATKETRPQAMPFKWRFCCDLLASQSEMVIEDLFLDYCLRPEGETSRKCFKNFAEHIFSEVLDEDKLKDFFGEPVRHELKDLVRTVVVNWGYADDDLEIREAWLNFKNILSKGDLDDFAVEPKPRSDKEDETDEDLE